MGPGSPKAAAGLVFTGIYTKTLVKFRANAYSRALMPTFKTMYKCRECGATGYQPVIDRAADGALKPTGEYKCTGCRNVFASLRALWEPRRPADIQVSKIGSQMPATGR